MVVAHMKNFTGEIALTSQSFIMDPKKTVGDVLKEKGDKVSSFIRLEVAEGIEKKAVDFAAGIAAVLATTKA